MRVTRILIGIGLVAAAGAAQATDDPHGSGSSISCEQCHITHSSLGDVLVESTDGLVSTLCLSCHTPGGWVGMTKELSSAEIADPGVSGTSHAWEPRRLRPVLFWITWPSTVPSPAPPATIRTATRFHPS